MTDRQLFGLFTGFERGEGWVPVFRDLMEPLPNAEGVYRRFLSLACGINDRVKQDELWAAELARRTKRAKEAEERFLDAQRHQVR